MKRNVVKSGAADVMLSFDSEDWTDNWRGKSSSRALFPNGPSRITDKSTHCD
jgi:hypothetical protein